MSLSSTRQQPQQCSNKAKISTNSFIHSALKLQIIAGATWNRFIAFSELQSNVLNSHTSTQTSFRQNFSFLQGLFNCYSGKNSGRVHKMVVKVEEGYYMILWPLLRHDKCTMLHHIAILLKIKPRQKRRIISQKWQPTLLTHWFDESSFKIAFCFDQKFSYAIATFWNVK